MVTAPTYRMLMDATLRTFLEMYEGCCAFIKSDMLATLPGGHTVLFRSADRPDRLRGPNLAYWWGDEAALYHPQVWRIMIGRLRAVRDAQAWLTTTPRGRNWLYDVFVARRNPNCALWSYETAANPHLPKEYVADLYASYDAETAAQELRACFTSYSGLVYPEFERAQHVTSGASGPFARVIAGVDEGYTNPSAILVIGLTTRDEAHVLDEFYARRVLRAELVARAVRLRQEHAIAEFYVDPAAAGLIAEMRAAGLDARPASNDVMPGIQHIKALLRPAQGSPLLTVAPNCPYTIAEFESYRWKEAAGGAGDALGVCDMPLREAPLPVNDHAMSALRYALYRPAVAPQSFVIRPQDSALDRLLGREHTI